MKNIAVFVSGSGSNLQAVIDACNNKTVNGKITAVISSKQGVYALKRAEEAGIDSYVFEKKSYDSADVMFGEILKLLRSKNIDLIVLAGYLSILPPSVIAEYKNRIINIHPSLIPSFCGNGFYGLKVHKAVLDYGCKVSGATVHFVDEGTDTGAVILQKAVKVFDGDTPEKLQKRVLKEEHKLLVSAVKLFCEDKIKVVNNKAVIIK